MDSPFYSMESKRIRNRSATSMRISTDLLRQNQSHHTILRPTPNRVMTVKILWVYVSQACASQTWIMSDTTNWMNFSFPLNPPGFYLIHNWTAIFFKNRKFLHDIHHKSGPGSILKSIGDVDILGTVHGYGEVWFNEKSIANILSFANVCRKFKIIPYPLVQMILVLPLTFTDPMVLPWSSRNNLWDSMFMMLE